MEVPKSNVVQMSQAQPQIDPTILAMAAAMLHQEGRVQAPGQQMAETDKVPWASLGPQEQKQLLEQSYTPKTEGERNKYDETLNEHGSVILDKKSSFGPNEWQDKLFDKDVQRFDLPDGRVILRRRGKEPLTS